MKLQLLRDTQGATAVELAATVPLFLLLTFGVIVAGWMMWIEVSLQHAVEMAARCASADAAAQAAGASPTRCNNTTNIQNFAVTNSYGLNPPASTFTVASPDPACGKQVSASYTFNYLTSHFFSAASLTIRAQSCYPSDAG